ncbi:4-(cytidine 5'-diphospho)-2-C-methyl-D-erythritol kinase [Psychromonas sp. CD1]|uniref:4-(cytidine 5'-diphospho)-2-C-methyl-D-erythritol kinase n=1 Tax=Psychromonas sp. CD1 TaxID=1979839 RepID=UPI000B9B49B9|nr:4-(cytidine 5'-diphospho)-2-C-methyl-D-erythritol kinase [Psychromonas sp. CD1]
MKTTTIHWPSPAKLNLFLYINQQRDDGYHELQTLFQFIDHCDSLTIKPNLSGIVTLSTTLENLPQEDNLIYKAAILLKEYAPKNYGVHIDLIKKIPLGGGLGGGSSNAATTLIALNYHWELNLSKKELADIGLSLGADVPIFIHGKAAIAEGVGEKLVDVYPVENYYLVAMPDCHVSTTTIFKHPDLPRQRKKQPLTLLMSQNWHNDCESCVKNNYPMVAKVIHWLIEYAPTRLTGTGACVFSTFATALDARFIQKKTPKWLNTFVCKGLNRSPLDSFLSKLK